MSGYHGITTDEQSKIQEFLEDCIIIDISEQIKEIVINLKRQHKLKLPDGIIIGTSIYLGIPVISADSDFTKITAADVVYYEKS